ncbi:hypothetical protein [Microbacterium sp. NPDC056057]|uniref:hypothetical protein n=1 Tax=Microbacterium sp. NPDC056057 TaxID=3345699 RepID=UPI0035E33029
MRRMRYAVATVAAAALVASTTTGATAATEPEENVFLKPFVLDAWAQYAASDTHALLEQQGKMATPNVYLADVARGTDQTGADPADYWYVRNGVPDDGVTLAPEAILYANLENLKTAGKIDDVNFTLVMNLPHSENVNTAEAHAWMRQILAEAGPSVPADVDPATGWWDVSTYQGGSITENAAGAVSASSDTGKRTITVTLNGQPFTVTHYWGWYAATPNSPKQKVSIYVPQNVRSDSPTYFRTNNGGWTSNNFISTVVPGGVYTTGNLAFNTVQGGGNNNPNVIGEVLDQGMIMVSYGARSMNDAPVDGEYQGHSPATMTDTKAAIRFVKYNQVYGSLPGDPERVIITGMSGGGGLTTAVAAGGNSSDYYDSLAQIGALGLTQTSGAYADDPAVGDDVFATFSSAPIIDSFRADHLAEWMYNPTRQKIRDGVYASETGITSGRNNPSALAEWQYLSAAVLAQKGDDYTYELGLTPDHVKRTLLDMMETSLELTLNENKSYRPTLADVAAVATPEQAKAALDTFLRQQDANRAAAWAGLPLDWYALTGTAGAFEVTIADAGWDRLTEYLYWVSQWTKGTPISTAQGLPAGLGKGGAFAGGEGLLFGALDAPYSHLNQVSWAMDPLNWPLFGVTASTNPNTAARQAENREIAKTLFDVLPGPSIEVVLRHVDQAERDGTLTGKALSEVRKHLAQAEKLAAGSAASRAVVAQLDNASRKSGLPADSNVVKAIAALAAAS